LRFRRSPKSGTVGFFRPVFCCRNRLWFESGLTDGIACHELIHVRRKDWLVTVIEELVAAFSGFTQGMVAFAQTRLSL